MDMLKRLNDLAFVIGAFFTIISFILFLNIAFANQNDTLSIYSATTFGIFGLLMMFARTRKK